MTAPAPNKKANHTDQNIRIRILKALGILKPFGLFKHYVMLKVIRNLKQPNIISPGDIWEFLNERYGVRNFDEQIDKSLNLRDYIYDDIV